MTIGVVIPSKRPHLLHRAGRMLEQQTTEGMLIPISGDGPPGVLRNKGVKVAKQLGLKLVAFWDDDDFYGPRYLEEQLAAWQPGRVVGKTFGFVAFNGGVVYFPLPKSCPTWTLLIGGSIFGAVDEMPEFTDMQVAEDGKFSADCRKKGLQTYLTSGRNFVYSRLGDKREDHTYKASDALVWLNAGGLGVPTELTPEQAMAADVPSGEAMGHKRWEEERGTERGRHRVPA